MNDFQLWMQSRKLIQDLRGGVGRTIVDGDNFQVGIIDANKCGEGGGKLLLFITSSKNQRKFGAIGVGRWRVIPKPGQSNSPIGDSQAVSEPEESDESEEEYLKETHADWSRKAASGYPNMNDQEPCHGWRRSRGKRTWAEVTGNGLASKCRCGTFGSEREESGAIYWRWKTRGRDTLEYSCRSRDPDCRA